MAPPIRGARRPGRLRVRPDDGVRQQHGHRALGGRRRARLLRCRARRPREGSTLHFRAVAQSDFVTVAGADQTLDVVNVAPAFSPGDVAAKYPLRSSAGTASSRCPSSSRSRRRSRSSCCAGRTCAPADGAGTGGRFVDPLLAEARSGRAATRCSSSPPTSTERPPRPWWIPLRLVPSALPAPRPPRPLDPGDSRGLS